MKSTRNKIAEIIRDGLLEDKLKELNEYLIEDAMNCGNEINVTESKREDILGALNKVRARRIEFKEKLYNANKVNFIGELLNSYLNFFNLELKEAKQKLNLEIEEAELSLLLKNTINITKIKSKALSKLFKSLNVTLEDSLDLLRKTHDLYMIEPIYRETMARYKPGETGVLKNVSMKDGFNELILKANENKKLKKKKEEYLSEKELNDYLIDFKNEYTNE